MSRSSRNRGFRGGRAPRPVAADPISAKLGDRSRLGGDEDGGRGAITLNKTLIDAFQAASSPHSIRALKSDIEAFDAWCRRTNRFALPATAETVADYLDARAENGSRPASLARYKASIAKIHQLLDLKDPTPAPLVKLRLQAVRREKGAAQKQARPLRFKGPVRDVERDKARGLNIRSLLESCANDLPGLRDRALLSTAYDTGLRASELVAVAVEHIEEAIDPEARLLQILRSKGDQDGEGRPPILARARSRRSRPGPKPPRSRRDICSGECRCGGTRPVRRCAAGRSTASPDARVGICARRFPSPQ
jgi:hypothetical protein